MTDMPTDWWTYRATPDPRSRYAQGVLDGDTYDVVVDLGFRTLQRIRIRALGIDTAEIFGSAEGSDEYVRGVEQRDWVRTWMAETPSTAADVEGHDPEWPLTLRTRKETGKYGRWRAEVYDAEGASLTEALVDAFGEEVRDA